MKTTSKNESVSAPLWLRSDPVKLAYFRRRQKNRIFESVMQRFAELAESEGLTKKELAFRLDKDPSQITRWFSGPGNLTLDTISDLLFAMDVEMSDILKPLKLKPSMLDHPESLPSSMLTYSGVAKVSIVTFGDCYEQTQNDI